MKIIGFRLNKINAVRSNPVKGKLEIKSGINIEDIIKEETSLSDKTALKIDFIFTLDYSPDFGKIEYAGSLITLDENEESKEILKDWKKKEFKHSSKISLFNFIMDKCNVQSLQLEQELGLPFHIPLPKLAAKKEE